MTIAPALEARDLKMWLETPRGTVRAVDGVSFRVAAGERIAIVGESGCGKSMTARTLLGLYPQNTRYHVSGQVLLNGQDLLTLREQQLCRLRGSTIGMVFQDPLTYLNPQMRIGKQIEEAIWLHDPKADLRAETADIVARVGLRTDRGFLASYPHELSGGMRQRVLLAMALASKPDVLVADEPTTALDVTLQAQILTLLEELCDDLGLALILITHDMGVVAELCDRVYVMYAGQIIEEGTAEALFDRPRHPYTRLLLDASLSVEGETDGGEVLTGAVPDLVRPPEGCRFRLRCRHAHARCLEAPPAFSLEPGSAARCWMLEESR